MSSYSLPIQPVRRLHLRRVDNGWLVWLAGTPNTQAQTYLYLFDNGDVHRVTESGDRIDVLEVKA